MSCTAIISCQQHIRKDKFDIACASINSSDLENLTLADAIAVGPMDSKTVSLSYEEKTQVGRQIAHTMKSLGYTNANPDPRPLNETGLLFFNDYQHIYKAHTKLSPRVSEDYKNRFPTAKWLVLSSIDGIKETNSKETHRYKTLQAISFKYKIWSLVSSRFIGEIGVEGYLYQSNERFVADSGSIAQRETANALYRLVTKDYPEKAPLEDLVTEATTTFIQYLKNLSQSRLKNTPNRPIPCSQ